MDEVNPQMRTWQPSHLSSQTLDVLLKMFSTTLRRGILYLSLGLSRVNLSLVFAQDLETFAALSGVAAEADDDFSCSATKSCPIGCCGPLWVDLSGDCAAVLTNIRDNTGKGVCGLGPIFCGEGCTSSCNYKSECDPGWGAQWSNATKCPLNVCCSEFGFCGTSASFCGGVVTPSPECGGRSADAKVIGYYEGWNLARPCGSKLFLATMIIRTLI